jgi:putative ABC transport system permease protein
VAFFALLVGGVGVLAVMLLSIKERVREIGVRRAVGAKRRDVRRQFLLESTILSLMGGAAGLLVSAVVTYASSLGPWDLAFPWRAAAVGLITTSLLGLAVGLVPANRAARLEPIQCLRAE